MKKTFFATLALAVGITGAAFAQPVTTDTVHLSIDEADVTNGVQDGSFTVNVWASLSEAINGGTLGFNWSDNVNWRLDSAIAGPATASWEIQGPVDTAIANAAGQVLLGGAGIFAQTAAGSDQLWSTMYFSLRPGNTWQAGDEMFIDSVFVAPSGEFVIVQVDTDNITPTFLGAQKVTFSDVSVDESASALPTSFGVSQNYPNPFNPNTKIDFAVATRSKVTIEVFNLLGQKVKTLVDGEMDAESYQVTWDGDNDKGAQVASGVYFYKMTAGDFVQTRKMMLMK